MSRRRQKDVDRVYRMVRLVCPRDETHHLPRVVRQMGRTMLENGIERIDGPGGHTKLSVPCPTCRAKGEPFEHQLRWDRIAELLAEMEDGDEHTRQYVLP